MFLVFSQVVWKWIDGKLTKLSNDGLLSSQDEPDNMSGEDTGIASPPSMRQSTDDEDTLPMEPTTSQLPKPQDDQDVRCCQSANDWAKLFGLDMSVPHAQEDMPHAANICTTLASAGIPRVSERPMGWAVENGSKMRDVVHLSCHACLTPAEKELHAANIIAFFCECKEPRCFLAPRAKNSSSRTFASVFCFI